MSTDDDSPDAYPRRVPGYHGECRCGADQVAFLAGFLPGDGRMIEVGTAAGVTAAILADIRPGASIACVDTFDGIDHPEVSGRLLDWRRNQRPNMGLWVGDLANLGWTLGPAARFDLAFVDADHSYDCTLECLMGVLPLMAPRGVIVAHDHDDPAWPEVAPAVAEFMGRSGWAVRSEGRFVVAMEAPR